MSDGPDTPRVSVVMPVLNEERTVEAAIESALAQSFQDTEILVVDGRSEDRTAAIVEELGARHPRVRLLSNPRRSIPAAMNVGLAQARGEFLVRMDAHLTLDDEYVETGLRVLAQHPGAAAVGGCRIGVATTPTGRAIARALSSPFGVGDSINHYATEAQETDHASMGVYRTAVLREVDGWDETLLANEDVDLDHRILAAGHTIRYEPAMAMYWAVRESYQDFSHQYRRYGRGKAAMVRKNGWSAVHLRHLAPPALVAGLTTGVAALGTGHPRVAAALLAPYPLALLAASYRDGGTQTDVSVEERARLLLAFVTMHLSWGVGFLEGTVGGAVPALSSYRTDLSERDDEAATAPR